MTTADLDKLDAAIASAPGPVIAMPRALIEQLARAARVSMGTSASLTAQGRMGAAIAGFGRSPG